MQRIHLTNYKKNTHRHAHSHSLGLGLSGCWCLPLTLTSSSTSRLSSALPKWADSRWSSWLSHLSSPSFPRPNNRGAMQHPPHLHSPSISLKTSLILRTVVRNFYFLSVCYLDSFLPIVFPFSFFLYSNASFFCLQSFTLAVLSHNAILLPLSQTSLWQVTTPPSGVHVFEQFPPPPPQT